MKIRSPIGESYAKHLEAFSNDKQNVHSDVLFQLFYDLYKIRQAIYRYKRDVKRQRTSSTADILQDLIGKYLRIKLSDDYEVSLEYKEKHEKLQPDIMIKKKGKNWAIIEVKTTIGWDRDLIRGGNFKKRIDKLSSAYGVPSKRVFYIFESVTNVGKDVERKFYDKGNQGIKEAILPLFTNQVGTDRIGDFYKDYSDEQIKERYDKVKFTPFDKILKKVK